MHNRRAEGDAAHSAQSEVDKGKAARNEDEEMQEEKAEMVHHERTDEMVGLNPHSLIKNIPSPRGRWKTPIGQ